MFQSNPIVIILLKILIIFSYLAYPTFNNAAYANSDNKIKIGFILPLTGEWSFLGEGIKNGAILADESFDKGSKLNLVFEDNPKMVLLKLSLLKNLIAVQTILDR